MRTITTIVTCVLLMTAVGCENQNATLWGLTGENSDVNLRGGLTVGDERNAEVFAEIGYNSSSMNDGEPDRHPEPSGQRTHVRKCPGQEALGIQQRNANRERVHEPPHQLAFLLLLIALEQLGGVRRHVRLQNIRHVELREQANHVVLRRRIVAERLGREQPDVVNGALPVHPGDKLVRKRGKSVDAAGGLVA